MAVKFSAVLWTVAGVVAAVSGYFLFSGPLPGENEKRAIEAGQTIVPVEVAVATRGRMSLERTFSGTIEPRAQVIVAPKISGRIAKLHVDVADVVEQGQLIAQMEDGEFEQAVVEAEAHLAVAEANADKARSDLKIAGRELERTTTLYDRGIASESDFDMAQAAFMTSQAAVKVAKATVTKEQALLRAARIRLSYTRVQAEWEQGNNRRTVAERFADEGNTVAANTSLFSIIEIDPVIVVIQVTEKDYPLLQLGQQARVRADAFADRVFTGTVSRISPIFRESSRQARLELEVANPDNALKPGMFARCTLELQEVVDAVSVPQIAITTRDNTTGVFRVTKSGDTVEWLAVEPGFTSNDRTMLKNSDLNGMVVTLGQQFVKDGSSIRITAGAADTHATEGKGGDLR